MPGKDAGYIAIGVGGLFLYGAIRGYSVLKALQNIVSGASPASDQTTTLFTTTSVGANTTSAIANSAIQYEGFPYSWGAAPNTGATDCSGFVNMIVGQINGLAIPGYKAGSYNGAAHGPPTLAWLAWTGCKTITLAQALPGDLAVFQTHMGIIITAGSTQANTMMVSDLNPTLKTKQTTIADAAPTGEILVVRRLG